MNSLVVLFAVVAAVVAAPHEKRSIGHAVAYSFPSAVSHQSRVDVHSSPSLVAPAPIYEVAEPVVETRAVYAAPAHTVYAGGSAVSHQSRVDVRTSPAVIEHTVVEPVVYAAPAAVAHQARVDVHSSPALLHQYLGAPVVDARSVWAPTLYASTW